MQKAAFPWCNLIIKQIALSINLLNGRVSPTVVSVHLEPEVPQGNSPAPACCGQSHTETPRKIVTEHEQMNIHNEIKLIFDMVPMLIFPKQAWMKTAEKCTYTLEQQLLGLLQEGIARCGSGGLLSPSCPSAPPAPAPEPERSRAPRGAKPSSALRNPGTSPPVPPNLPGLHTQPGSPPSKTGISGAEIVDLIAGLFVSQVNNRFDYRSPFRQVNNRQSYLSVM